MLESSYFLIRHPEERQQRDVGVSRLPRSCLFAHIASARSASGTTKQSHYLIVILNTAAFARGAKRPVAISFPSTILYDFSLLTFYSIAV